MGPFRHVIGAAMTAGLFAMTIQCAFAITAKDVMEKMTEKERFGYVTGLVDMLSYQSLLAGNRQRAQCIADAFYGKKNETWQTLFAVFGKHPDKAPEGLVTVVMNHACGA